jgi:hypothetical protein
MTHATAKPRSREDRREGEEEFVIGSYMPGRRGLSTKAHEDTRMRGVISVQLSVLVVTASAGQDFIAVISEHTPVLRYSEGPGFRASGPALRRTSEPACEVTKLGLMLRVRNTKRNGLVRSTGVSPVSGDSRHGPDARATGHLTQALSPPRQGDRVKLNLLLFASVLAASRLRGRIGSTPEGPTR